MWKRHPVFSGITALSLIASVAVAAGWIYAAPDTANTTVPVDQLRVRVIANDLYVSWPDKEAPWWSMPTRTDQRKMFGTGFVVTEWSNGAQWWQLLIPMINLLLLTAMLPTYWLIRCYRLHRRVVESGLCIVCGYDLRGSTGDCPECGAKRVA